MTSDEVFGDDDAVMLVRHRVVAAGGALAVVAAGAVSAPAVARQVIHPRDPAAYRLYLETYIDTTSTNGRPDGSEADLAWVRADPEAALVEGDRACGWLAQQQDAPADVDPTGHTSWAARYETYLRESPFGTTDEVSDEGKAAVVAGAWTYLCWWDLRDKTAPLHPGSAD